MGNCFSCGENENNMENTIPSKRMKNKPISEVQPNPKTFTNKMGDKSTDSSKPTKGNLRSSNPKNMNIIIKTKTNTVENLSNAKESVSKRDQKPKKEQSLQGYDIDNKGNDKSKLTGFVKENNSMKPSKLTMKVLCPSNNIEKINDKSQGYKKLCDQNLRKNNALIDKLPISDTKSYQYLKDCKFNEKPNHIHIPKVGKENIDIDKNASRRSNSNDKIKFEKIEFEGTSIDALSNDYMINNLKEKTSDSILVNSEKATKSHNSAKNVNLTNVQNEGNSVHAFTIIPDNQRLTNIDDEVRGHNKILCGINENQIKKTNTKFECCINDMKYVRLEDGSPLPNIKYTKSDTHNIERHQFDNTESPQIISDKERSISATNIKLNVMVNSKTHHLFTSYDKSESTSDDSQRTNRESKFDSYEETFPYSHHKNNIKDEDISSGHKSKFSNYKSTNLHSENTVKSVSQNKQEIDENKISTPSKYLYQKHDLQLSSAHQEIKPESQNIPIENKYVKETVKNKQNQNNQETLKYGLKISSNNVLENKGIILSNVTENPINDESKFEEDSQISEHFTDILERNIIENNSRKICVQADSKNNINIPPRQTENISTIFSLTDNVDYSLESTKPSRKYDSELNQNKSKKPIQNTSNISENMLISNSITHDQNSRIKGNLQISEEVTNKNCQKSVSNIDTKIDMEIPNQGVNISSMIIQNDFSHCSTELSDPPREFTPTESPSQNDISNQIKDSVPSHFNLNGTNTGKVIVSKNCHNEVTDATETNKSVDFTDQNFKQIENKSNFKTKMEIRLGNSFKFKNELFVNHKANKYINNYMCGRGNENNLPIGFKNPSGYCYLNSVVQVIVSCQDFIKDLESYDKWNNGETNDDIIFVRALFDLIQALKRRNHSQVASSLETVQSYINESAFGDDVYKCFMNLLTRVSSVIKRGSNNADTSNYTPATNEEKANVNFKKLENRNPGFVFNNFYGQITFQTICKNCNTICNESFQMIKSLPLPVPITTRSVTLTDCINLFLNESDVEVDSPMECVCRGGTFNLKSVTRITHPPKYLFAYLNRGSYSNDGMKNETTVTCDHIIEIETTTGFKNYQLISVIDHIGNSSYGHYYCKCSYETYNWCLVNDTQVDLISSTKVVTKQAIVFLFKQL